MASTRLQVPGHLNFPNMTSGPNGGTTSNSIEAPLDLKKWESLNKLTLYSTVWAEEAESVLVSTIVTADKGSKYRGSWKNLTPALM